MMAIKRERRCWSKSPVIPQGMLFMRSTWQIHWKLSRFSPAAPILFIHYCNNPLCQLRVQAGWLRRRLLFCDQQRQRPRLFSNFAFFRNSALQDTWWIAIEDLPFPILTEGIGDYNDMIVQFSSLPDPIPTPEPATMLLLGSGLLRWEDWREKNSINNKVNRLMRE